MNKDGPISFVALRYAISLMGMYLMSAGYVTVDDWKSLSGFAEGVAISVVTFGPPAYAVVKRILARRRGY